jgi:peptidoglycan hydrolase CwlO-like protein
MNKKFLSAVLFGALMVSSTGTFVSCKDYDEDIDRIDKELVDIKSALSALQAKVDAGKYVTNVVKNGDGRRVFSAG